jgi:hypothetical protein
VPPDHPIDPPPPDEGPGSESSPAADLVELVTPVGREWDSVARLVLAGIGDRIGLSVEELDDLQLALERLLHETGPADPEVRVLFELEGDGQVRLRVGPLRELAVMGSLRSAEAVPAGLGLRRILETVVDSFAVEDGPDGGVLVDLEKHGRGARVLPDSGP